MNDDVIQFDYIQEWSHGNRKLHVTLAIEKDDALSIDILGDDIAEHICLDASTSRELYYYLKSALIGATENDE